MKINKLIAILLTAAIVAGLLAGCGGGENTSPVSTPTQNPSPIQTPEPSPSNEPSPSPEPSPEPYGDILAAMFVDVDTVAPGDNLGQIRIAEVIYSDSDIKIKFGVNPDMRPDVIIAYTYFINSEDHSEYIHAAECTFHGGSFGAVLNPDYIGVPKSTADKGLIVLFEGITAELSENFETVPLFFTIELGVAPRVVSGPLYAGNLFDHILNEDDLLTGLPEEYIGSWAGSVDDINLSFTIEADGSGIYTFEQSGYVESYGFTLEAGTETFSVQIPANNTLGIATIEGTYAYSDGVMTLDVQTTFATGRVFEYTVPCRKG